MKMTDLKTPDDVEQFTISKKYTFEYAHRLLLHYQSKCQNIHGHSGKLEVKLITDNIQDNGLLIDLVDFEEVKQFVDTLDHSILISELDTELIKIAKKLNNRHVILNQNNTSMECICQFIADKVSDILLQKLNSLNLLNSLTTAKLVVEMKETDNNSASCVFNLL